MYEVQFSATTSADWAQAIELMDADTNLPLDLTGASFDLAIGDRWGDSRYLSVSTDDDAELVIIAPNIVEWVFPAARLNGLCSGITYPVGLTMTTDTGTIQIFLGTLAVLNGVVSL
jgi:hypothetical protein